MGVYIKDPAAAASSVLERSQVGFFFKELK